MESEVIVLPWFCSSGGFKSDIKATENPNFLIPLPTLGDFTLHDPVSALVRKDPGKFHKELSGQELPRSLATESLQLIQLQGWSPAGVRRGPGGPGTSLGLQHLTLGKTNSKPPEQVG